MKIVVVAGDAGGARALVPVMHALKKEPGCQVECHAYGAAQALWSQEGFLTVEAHETDLAHVDIVLCGTSVNKTPWELRYIQAAQKKRIPGV